MTPERPYQPEFEPKHPKLVWVTHIDFVFKHLHFDVVEDLGVIEGSLDNLAPSSILLGLQGKLKGKTFFTEDEESNMIEAQKIAKEIYKHHKPEGVHRFGKDRSWLPMAVVLEVTEEGTDVDVMVENLVMVDIRRIKKALDVPELKDVTYKINPTGAWDESYRFSEAKIPAFSLCLPIHGELHSLRSWVEIGKIDKFRRAILAIDKHF